MISSSLAFVAVVIASGLVAQAATLNLNNLSSITGGTSHGSLILLDDAGNPLTSGFVALYSFAGAAPDSASILQSGGSSGLLDLVALSPANNPGPGAFAGVLSSPNDGSLNGRNLFIVLGTGGTDVSNASALAMIDTGLAFTSADNPGPAQVLSYFLDTQSSVVFGSLVDQTAADWSFAGQPDFTSAGLALVVPESSSSFLLVAAGLSLLARRRRKMHSIC